MICYNWILCKLELFLTSLQLMHSFPSGFVVFYPDNNQHFTCQTPMNERYALFFTLPAESPLYQTASAWLEYDAYTGLPSSDGSIPPCPDPSILRSTPAKYGFHATLKAPFRLKPGVTIDQLSDKIRLFCQTEPSFESEPLTIDRVGHRLALVSKIHCHPMASLAEKCLRVFEPFRAELNEMEYRRRKPEKLSSRQLDLLDKWGYPFVLDEFRFHMTLTNRLAEGQIKPAGEYLSGLFAPGIDQPLKIDRIYLFHQPANTERFRVVSGFELKG